MGHSNDYGEEIFYQFRLVHKKFKEYTFGIVKEKGITMTQFLLAAALHEHPNITLNELSERVGLSKSTVSVAIEQLVKSDVIVRKIPEENRRCVQLSINSKFLCEWKEFMNKSGFMSEINDNFSEVESQQLVASLKKLNLLMASSIEKLKNKNGEQE